MHQARKLAFKGLGETKNQGLRQQDRGFSLNLPPNPGSRKQSCGGNFKALGKQKTRDCDSKTVGFKHQHYRQAN